MRTNIYQSILLSVSLCVTLPLAHSASIASPTVNKVKTSTLQTPTESMSFLAKAAEKKHLNDGQNTQNLQMFASIQATPSQNFLAQHNQRFTRFIQALFS